ncbi:cryptococcal mannosyltransferase 1-domain-containing protein, partial [Tricladium varicosporioides]
PGFSIPDGETVFIAANIVDAGLIEGAWGDSLAELVELIGRERVYVSIFGGPTDALRTLDSRLRCEKRLVSEEVDRLNMSSIPKTKLPTGEERIKRIAYLAEVRNKALEPMEKMERRFDKVLFINDVFFKPRDAARLLWGTNLNEDGEAEYKAACGLDFVSWWKYYDTFATRDAEGFSLGVPIFPWFANEGEARSRNDLLDGRDSIRVKSCWGGITAFDGRFFRGDDKNNPAPGHLGVPGTEKGVPQLPLRFRSEPEPFWDASECCLIHADIMALPEPISPYDTGIYMNPYVRVAYDKKTFGMLSFGKRVERLFSLPQRIINYYAKMPHFNIRRTEIEGEIILDKEWVSTYWKERGHYVDVERVATRGAYCGVRQLLVMKEGHREEGEGNWDNL